MPAEARCRCEYKKYLAHDHSIELWSKITPLKYHAALTCDVATQVVPAGTVDKRELAKLAEHLSHNQNVTQHQRNVLHLSGEVDRDTTAARIGSVHQGLLSCTPVH